MTELSKYSDLEAYRIRMTSSSINVKELYFEFQELTPVHGEPIFETLQNLLAQLKANASSVPTSLGGGGHGFIVDILSPPLWQLSRRLLARHIQAL